MEVHVRKTKIGGRVFAPASKSITHRAVICAALAQGKSTIENPLTCDDTTATCNILQALGTGIEKGVTRWEVFGTPFQSTAKPLYCNESGTTWRFMTAILSVLGITLPLSGEPSLIRRPLAPLTEALENIGGEIKLDGNISSQFVSALLLAAPLAKKKTTLKLTTPMVSKPYVDLTINMQKAFGVKTEHDEKYSFFEVKPQDYKPADLTVEGDWSSGAFLIALGILGGKIVVDGLNEQSLQADRAVEKLVSEMGGVVYWKGEKLFAKKSLLNGIDWDLTKSPDLFPVAAALATCADGKTILRGIEHLRFKESNRLESVQTLLKKMGIPCGIEKDSFWIHGEVPKGKHKGIVVDSKDHRIVMAAAVLGLITQGNMILKQGEAINKSFPDFWKQIPSQIQ